MDLFDLAAKVTLDTSDYEKGVQSASNSALSFGDVLKANIASDVIMKGVEAIGNGIASLGSKFVDLTKDAVEAYANYEQLVGGVETLFGIGGTSLEEYAAQQGKAVDEVFDEWNSLTAAQRIVLNNSEEAYKTAGLSANEYMETVTSFSAALISSVGNDTRAAAEKADQAITDMSDNANKMGSSMESIQNAYQGFAKQNYTMLDNLKLGFGGTKEEMQRLLDTANQINAEQGVITDYQIDSYADIVDAIHVVQTEMGITGTTSKEAATTIEGSMNSMKAAWENVVTGIGGMGSADNYLGVYIKEFADSVVTFAGNAIPVVETAINGIGELVSELLPVIADEIPTVITEVLPALVESGENMLSSIIEGFQNNGGAILDGVMSLLQSITDDIIENLPSMLDTGMNILFNIAQGILDAIPVLAETIANMLGSMAQYIRDNLPTIIATALEMIQNFATTIAENLPIILEAGIDLLIALTEGIIEALPVLIEMLPQIIDTFANVINDNFPRVIAAGVEIIVMLIKGLIQAVPVIIQNMPMIIKAIWDTLKAVQWLNLGKDIINLFANGLKNAAGLVSKSASELVSNLKNAFTNLPNTFKDIGKNIVMGLINGIKNNIAAAVSNAVDAVGKVVDGVKDALGIHSPSKVFAGIGDYMVQGLSQGWDDNIAEVKKNITSDMSFDAGEISASSNYSMNSSNAINAAIAQLNNLPDNIADAISELNITLNKREVGRMVREYV